MISSDIKAAFRTFYREKAYAYINLAGLALAIACCLILGLYLKDELTYDTHHLRHKEIFRVVNAFNASGDDGAFAITSVALGPMLKENYPEKIIDYVRFRFCKGLEEKILIKVDNEAFYWTNVFHADANVFDVFTHEILYGDREHPETALKDPQSAAVSETFAKKYFGDEDPIGKIIHVDTAPDIPRKIALVFKDLPDNTFLKYDVLLYEQPNLGANDQRNRLFNVNYFTYLVMSEDFNPADYKAINDEFFEKFMSETATSLNTTWRSWIEPLTSIHLDSDLPYDISNKGNKYYIFGFAAVALFILIVACINYINLAIARATKRAREIGMRKILGVPRGYLVFRYLGEAILFSFIAMVLGVFVVEVVLNLTSINTLFGKPLALNFYTDLLWIFGLAVIMGILSGIYPAAYLSSISPLSAITETKGKKKGTFRLREFLVLIQFTVSVVVIAGTLVMSMQMRFIANKPLGFEKENRVVVYLRGLDVVKKVQVIKNDLLKNSNILGVTASRAIVGTGKNFGANLGEADNNEGVLEKTGFFHIPVEKDFIKVMGIEMVEGRDFSRRLLTDIGSTFIVNETFVKSRGWDQAIGKRIKLGGESGKVIGVVKDFHSNSLHKPVSTFMMYPFRDNFENFPEAAKAAVERKLILHISGENIPKTLSFLEDRFATYDAVHPFDYAFLDDLINENYLSEENLMKMTGIFSGICIFISCLGLYGLAAYNTEQRKKEIGIRKVLGSSAFQIILMLAKKTLWLVLAGSVAAAIIAYFALNEWLANFAYRMDILGISLIVYPLAALLVIAVAFITIALQSYRIAQSNPSLTIRYE